MFESKESINLLGAVIANINNVLLMAIFTARIYKFQRIEHWIGIVFMLSIIPLIMMFFKSFQMERSFLYFVQLGLMISFIVLEFILDYALKIDFRQNQYIVFPFITLFYASLGGMIGIAGHSGKPWMIVTVITFFAVTAVSLIMHFKTGT